MSQKITTVDAEIFAIAIARCAIEGGTDTVAGHWRKVVECIKRLQVEADMGFIYGEYLSGKDERAAEKARKAAEKAQKAAEEEREKTFGNFGDESSDDDDEFF